MRWRRSRTLCPGVMFYPSNTSAVCCESKPVTDLSSTDMDQPSQQSSRVATASAAKMSWSTAYQSESPSATLGCTCWARRWSCLPTEWRGGCEWGGGGGGGVFKNNLNLRGGGVFLI